MFGLPGGSSGGGPIGAIAFWLAIIFTTIVVAGLVWYLIRAVEQI